LVTVNRIVAGIGIDNDLRRRAAAGTDKQLYQVIVEQADATGLGGAHFQQRRAFLPRQLGVAAGIGVLEAGQRRTAGQGVVRLRRHVRQDLEQRIHPQPLGVVAVRIAGEDLVDLLRQEGFGGMVDVLRRAGIGQPLGECGNDPQGLFHGADREQASIRDDAAAIETQMELLRTDLPQAKVLCG